MKWKHAVALLGRNGTVVSTARAGRIARSALALAGLASLVAACSAAPGESVAHGSAAVSTGIITRGSQDTQITNGNGGCLDLPDGNTTNGTLLHIWACDSDGLNQTWFVDTKGSIHYAADPTKCVDFPAQDLVNGVPTDQTQLQLWDCNGASGPDQVWQFMPDGNIEFAGDTAKCVELENGGYPFVNGSAQDGTPVQVFDCNGTSGQTWWLVDNSPVQGFQLQDGNGACLEAPPPSAAGGTVPAGTGLVLAPCNASGAYQTWGMDGTGTLFNYGSNNVIALFATFPPQDLTPTGFVPETQLVMEGESWALSQAVALSPSSHTLVIGGRACVEARGGYSTPGTVVQGFTCNGTTGQTWYPRPVGGYDLHITNVTTRYNDIAFQITSSSWVSWGWKVTSGNLDAQGDIGPGGAGGYDGFPGQVDVGDGTHYLGPPYAVSPSTTYSISFYPGGVESGNPPQATISFYTPRDTTPACELDHNCGQPGDFGDGSCTPGLNCCPNGVCGDDSDSCDPEGVCF